MSIPLDRLYNFLHDVCNRDDIIIYRFFPHGSKKISDLILLDPMLNAENNFFALARPAMFFYDQEPLDYDSFSPKKLEDFYHQTYTKAPCYASEYFKKIITSMNLRIAHAPALSIYDKMLLCHSEKNSSDLDKYLNNGFIGVYYWSHALIARDWFRYAETDPILKDSNTQPTKDFLIYNRAWSGTREYRLKFAELINELELTNSCKMAFRAIDDGIHYTQHKYKNNSFAISNHALETIFPINTASSCSSADYSNSDYATCGAEVVLETLFDDSRIQLTEKSLRPIACGKPFILVSTPGSLEYIRSYGFKTFAPWINESYDNITDPLERLTAIAQEMKRISILSPEQKQAMRESLYEITQYNKNLFFSKQWHDSIVQEYITNLTEAIKELDQYKLGTYWKQVFDPELNDEIIRSVVLNSNGHKMNQMLQNNQATLSIIPSQSSPGASLE
jgi:hypothetical protein